MRSLTAAVAAALVLLPAAPAWAANSAPVLTNDVVDVRNTGGTDHVVDALANDRDPDGDPLTYTSVGPATRGVASIRDGQLYYRPTAGEHGLDSFTYTVTDGQGNTATGIVTAQLWVDPPTPTGLSVTGTAGSVTLTWPAVDRAVDYRVFRDGWLLGRTTDLTASTSGLALDRQYEFRIAAVNGYGIISSFSEPVFRRAQAPAPTDLVVEKGDTPTTLSLTWSTGGLLGPWNVYRDGALLTTTSLPRHQDTGLTSGREYHYQVQNALPSTATEARPPGLLSAVAARTPAALSAIDLFVRDLGAAGGLGSVTVPERAIPGGRQQDHQSGVVVQRSGGTPFSVTGSFHTAYAGAGGATGNLGFPLMQMACGLRSDGCLQEFEGGALYASRDIGVRTVFNPYLETWGGHGWEDGRLGYPTTDEVCGLAGRGCAQVFQGGYIHWSPASGMHAVFTPYAQVWGRYGGESGRMGYPVGSEVCGLPAGGCAQVFQGGYIHWSPTSGMHAVFTPYAQAWGRYGGEAGRMGYPVGSEACGLPRGGCAQQFQGGYIHWSPASGMHAVFTPYAQVWGRYGGESGRMGYPVGSEACGLPAGGCFQQFQDGYIHWSPASGMHAVFTPYLQAWGRHGGESGPMGYPTGGEICGLRAGGCYQPFQHGAVYSSPASGTHAVFGRIRDIWVAEGAESGRLGYPVNGQAYNRTLAQTFQGGTIEYSFGRSRVTYR